MSVDLSDCAFCGQIACPVKHKRDLHPVNGYSCPNLSRGIRPCTCDLPRCPKCGYTRHDAHFEMDHRLCDGAIQWSDERREK